MNLKTSLLIALATLTFGNISLSAPSKNKSDEANKESVETARTWAYKCNNYDFGTRTSSNNVTLYLPNRTVVLDQVPSASGAKYQNSNILFWNKGDRALLEIEGKTYNCQHNSLRDPRATGGQKPVDFRATGNEPGWLLEIVDEDSIRILTNYANNRAVAPTPSPQSVEEAKIYEVKTESHRIRIIIQQESCIDTMSGEQFESKVTMHLDDETFTGCGRRLD
jgi:putative lipoprotein